MLQKSILVLLCAFFATAISAQTAAIAHKSHSGKPKTMPYLREGGFGNPPDQIVKVVKINATTIVEFKESFSGYKDKYADTVKNHPYFCKMPLAELKQRFPHITFEGYEAFEAPQTTTQQTAPKTPEKPAVVAAPVVKKTRAKAKKKRKAK